jgi:hypothetical protein
MILKPPVTGGFFVAVTSTDRKIGAENKEIVDPDPVCKLARLEE